MRRSFRKRSTVWDNLERAEYNSNRGIEILKSIENEFYKDIPDMGYIYGKLEQLYDFLKLVEQYKEF